MSFPERLERILIAALALAIAMITQRWSKGVFQAGLLLLVVSTLLTIPVGNLPRSASPLRNLGLIVLILAGVAAVFGLGILLTPVLSGLGR